jgi:hypothetical protein
MSDYSFIHSTRTSRLTVWSPREHLEWASWVDAQLRLLGWQSTIEIGFPKNVPIPDPSGTLASGMVLVGYPDEFPARLSVYIISGPSSESRFLNVKGGRGIVALTPDSATESRTILTDAVGKIFGEPFKMVGIDLMRPLEGPLEKR